MEFGKKQPLEELMTTEATEGRQETPAFFFKSVSSVEISGLSGKKSPPCPNNAD